MPRVSLENTDKHFDVNEDEVIYDALHDRGEQLPHGCLSGSCGACRIEVTKGAENLSPASVVEKNTVEAVIDELKKTKGEDYFKNKIVRLACRAKVKGDISILPLKK